MKKLSIVSIVLLLLSLFAGAFNPTIFAGQSQHEQVTICHATGSNTNPYNKITVDDDDVDGNNNSDHNRDGHQNGEDIIPPGTWDADGRNWTTQGQAIWNNACNVPTTTSTPTPTNTPTPTTTPTGAPWNVDIIEENIACGVNRITLHGTAQYGGDTSTTLLITVNNSSLMDNNDEKTGWEALLNVVPGQTYTIWAFVYDSNNPVVTGNNQDTPKSTDAWVLTVPTCSTPTETPTPTVEVTPTPTVETTPTPTQPANTGTQSDGLSDGRSDGLSSCPECTKAPQGGQVLGASTSVLGASTMAGTGSFTGTLMNLYAIFGTILLMAGFKSYAKENK